MKYDELPKLWKKQALKMIITFYQEGVNILAKEEKVSSWKITKESQEVKDAINDWEFEIDIDEITNKKYLSRVWDSIKLYNFNGLLLCIFYSKKY